MANQYDFTPELKAKIWAKIKERKPNLECPVCHWQDHFEMADGFASIPLMWNVWVGTRKSALPSAALVCTKCGNTLLFNLIALGFALEIGPDMDKILGRQGLK